MSGYADKIAENKSQSIVNRSPEAKKDRRDTLRFEDNRPQAAAQRKIEEAINSSPRMQQLKADHKFMNNSVRIDGGRLQKKANNTGLPNSLKNGIENLSGLSMDDTRVHYNSSKPARLNAHAYAQGSDIHIAPGQEKHLPHEAWHVVQQKQGRVKATMQMKGGVALNDDSGLEREADLMGGKAANNAQGSSGTEVQSGSYVKASGKAVQRVTDIQHTAGNVTFGGKQGLVGLSMVADLDPFDPIKGSTPDGNASLDLYTEVAKSNPSNYARGHLLNHDLGGKGDAENLYPISKGANARHSFLVERKVKQALFNLKQTEDANGQSTIRYSVKVLGVPEKSQFDCTWEKRSPSAPVVNLGKEVIESELSEEGGFIRGRPGPILVGWRHKGHSKSTDPRIKKEILPMPLPNNPLMDRTDTKEKIQAQGGVFDEHEISAQDERKAELYDTITATFSRESRPDVLRERKNRSFLIGWNTLSEKWVGKVNAIQENSPVEDFNDYEEQMEEDVNQYLNKISFGLHRRVAVVRKNIRETDLTEKRQEKRRENAGKHLKTQRSLKYNKKRREV